jgi:hypothetical protein
MIKINVANFVKELDKVLSITDRFAPTAPEGSRIVRIAAQTVLGEMHSRIVLRGEATVGQIGTYSSKPAYFSTRNVGDAARIGRPLGKPNEKGTSYSKFKTGKRAGQDHASRWFGGGYAEFKNKLGKSEAGYGKVNLSLTGTMMNGLQVLPTTQGWGLGWANKSYTDRAKHFEKEVYKKRIFGASLAERVEMRKALKFEMSRAVSS